MLDKTDLKLLSLLQHDCTLALLALGAGMVLWLLVLQRIPVGIAYPMLSLNFVWVTLAARAIWHEQITLRHACGLVLIIIGVALLGSSL